MAARLMEDECAEEGPGDDEHVREGPRKDECVEEGPADTVCQGAVTQGDEAGGGDHQVRAGQGLGHGLTLCQHTEQSPAPAPAPPSLPA